MAGTLPHDETRYEEDTDTFHHDEPDVHLWFTERGTSGLLLIFPTLSVHSVLVRPHRLRRYPHSSAGP